MAMHAVALTIGDPASTQPKTTSLFIMEEEAAVKPRPT